MWELWHPTLPLCDVDEEYHNSHKHIPKSFDCLIVKHFASSTQTANKSSVSKVGTQKTQYKWTLYEHFWTQKYICTLQAEDCLFNTTLEDEDKTWFHLVYFSCTTVSSNIMERKTSFRYLLHFIIFRDSPPAVPTRC